MVKEGYKQTEIGLIPQDWEVKQLSEIGIFSKGKGVRKDESQSGEIPCIRYGEIYTHHNNYVKKFNSFISSEVSENAKKIKNGDILFAGSGETKEEIGKCIAFINDFEAFAGGDIVILSPKDSNSLFLGYILNTSLINKQKSSKGQGDAVVHISANSLASILLPIPPKEEQKAIAKALSDMDELISSLEKLISKKDAIKQGTMQQLLTGKKRLSGFSGEWEEKSLEEISKTFTKQTGFDYSASIKPNLIQKSSKGYIPFIQNKDFEGKFINYKTDYYVPENIAIKFPRILLNEKCLLISISGSIGNVGVFSNMEMAFIGGAVAVVKFKDKDLLDWCMYYLLSNDGQNKLLGNVKAGSHQNLILDDLRKIEIPIPSKEEQQAIAQILSDMDNEIETLKQKLSKTKAIKDGIMSELLTGKTRLRVKDE